MLTAQEHPDTADVALDTILAKVAAGFVLVAFGLPLLLAAFR